MRLTFLSVALLFLTTSGCALTNPFAKRSTEEIYRERIFADAKAQYDRGNYDAGRRILEQLEAESDPRLDPRDRDGSTGMRLTSFEQSLPGTTAQEFDELVEMLVALQPLSERAKKREDYRRLTAAQLRQILSSYESTHLIGQNQLQRLRGVPEGNDARVPSTMIAGRTAPPRGTTTAPDPRQQELPPLGIGTPWDGQIPQGPSVAEAGMAPRLPATGLPPRGSIGLTAPLGPPAGGVQPVGGVVPAVGGRTVSPLPTTADPNLPMINPGPSGLSDLPAIYPAGTAPAYSPQGPIIRAGGESAPRQTAQRPVQLLPPIGQGGLQALPPQTGLSNPAQTPVLQTPGPLTVPQDPRTGIPGRISEGVQIIGTRMRDAAGRLPTTFRHFTGSPGSGTVAAVPVGQTAAWDVNTLIAQLESQLAASAPGETEAERLDYVQRHVNLRLLYLVAGRHDQALEPIQSIPADHQEFWQQLVWSMASYFDAQGQPQASARASQTVDQLRTAITRLKAGADLQLRNVSFCHKIVSFGNYERFSRDQFTPGQPVLLYAEVENFESTMVDSDRFRTALKSTISIHKTGDESQPLEAIEFPVTEDFCRNYRRDYFHSYEFSIPQKLEPGLYTLTLRVEDQLGQKTAMSPVNFQVE